MRLKKNNKCIVTIVLMVVVFMAVYGVYSKYISSTKIAVVEFPDFMYEKMEKANSNTWVKIKKLTLDETDKLKNFPFALIRGHGIRISEEQLNFIKKATKKGTKIYVADLNNPEYNFTNVLGEELDYITDLMENKGTKNYRSLFNYVRKNIDKKKLFLKKYDEPVVIPDNYLFHVDEELIFKNVDEYEKYYRERGFYKENRPKVVLLAGNINMQNSNTEHTMKFINNLEKQNFNVYPLRSFGSKKLQFLEEINPDIILLRPHGRLAIGKGNSAEKWLREHNVPVLAPQTIHQEYNEWLKDPHGMYGGMLSMSIVIPELDGAVAPYAVIAKYKNEQGNLIFDVIDNRMEEFCELTSKWANLQLKSNKDKKIAIYYFKGPGKNALVASGMEVIPSLYNVLKKLKQQGYNLDGLPSTKNEFEKILMKRGPVLGPYAHGAMDNYLNNGAPVLVEKEIYEKWCEQAMPGELYQRVIDKYGEAPGKYMSIEKNGKQYIAVTCVRFGNISLLPQPMPGIGKDTQRLVHGAKTAPPHAYIASYLWMRYGFNADAIIHFGTHGSLEFTPGKQVALSDYDWPDRLIGTTPHFYNYTINNIGEGMIAKRRSYATLITYLTPPFMKSGLNDDLKQIHNKIDKFNSLPNGPVREQYIVSIKKLAEKLNINKALNIDSTKNYSEIDIHKIHEYLEEIEQEKVTAGLYTLGVPYSQKKLNNSTRLMALDPIAFSLAELDLMRKKITQNQYKDELYVSKKYRPIAEYVINKILSGEDEKSIVKKIISNEEYLVAEKWKNESEVFITKKGSNEKENIKKIKTKIGEKNFPLIIEKLCVDSDNFDFLKKLKSEKILQKYLSMIDSEEYKKIQKKALERKDVAPEIYNEITIVSQPQMIVLLNLMRNTIIKNKIFEIIENEKFEEKINARREVHLKKIAADCDSPEKRIWFNRIFGENQLPQIKNFDIDTLKKGLEIINFIKNNTECFKYCKNRDFVELHKDIEEWNKKFRKITESIKNIVVKKEEQNERYAKIVWKIVESISNVKKNRRNLTDSPKKELDAVINALNGGYTDPSSGGDPIVNSCALPTGRNMYALDAERTPSNEAWKVGKRLAESLLEKEKKFKGQYPKKISFSLWSTNFISTEGATIAQILYLLGVEPIRDGFGTVRSLKLIPIEKLGRPRIDVVMQTSGQLRDIAASRLELIDKAIALAAEADDSLNFVKKGLVDAEKFLLNKGFSPIEARKFSSKRIFGGVNGNYGTGIMGLVEKGDAWENERQIAKEYINNMGAVYDGGEDWGTFKKGVFEAALQNTEVVVQPRSGNTWGPLSLDHVYEFMGGISLAVRNVTGNDPTAYFNDFRNMNRPKMQELKEAIGVETNSTVFNPKYIKELLNGEASSMNKFAETFRNTYGWNVMKPSAIDNYIWDNYYEVYVMDKWKLNIKERFEEENPYALQEMTSVMIETARKGYWNASEQQLKKLSKLHCELIRDHEAGCSSFVCDNAKLREFISKKVSNNLGKEYKNAIDNVRKVNVEKNKKNVVLKREQKEVKRNNRSNERKESKKENYSIGLLLCVLFLLCMIVVIKKTRS